MLFVMFDINVPDVFHYVVDVTTCSDCDIIDAGVHEGRAEGTAAQTLSVVSTAAQQWRRPARLRHC